MMDVREGRENILGENEKIESLGFFYMLFFVGRFFIYFCYRYYFRLFFIWMKRGKVYFCM